MDYAFTCMCCSRHVPSGDGMEDSFHTYGSSFFPEGVGVCGECFGASPESIMKVVDWEKSEDMDEVINQLKGEELDSFEELDFDGEGDMADEVISEIVSNRIKIGGKVKALKDKVYDFDPRGMETWAEIIYQKAWKNDPRSVGERCAWFSDTNQKIVQARIVDISQKEGKTFYKVEALSSENYEAKDAHGRMRKGGPRKVEEGYLRPPRVKGNVVFSKRNVCYGCKKVHLDGLEFNGLDNENHWFCKGCIPHTVVNTVCSHAVNRYQEHFGKPMDEFPGWLPAVKAKARELNKKMMEEQNWPKPHPHPLPKSKVPPRSFGETQEQKDLRWVKDKEYLNKCGDCGQHVIRGKRGWGDSWYCEFCWYTWESRNCSGEEVEEKKTTSERVKDWLEEGDSSVVPDTPVTQKDIPFSKGDTVMYASREGKSIPVKIVHINMNVPLGEDPEISIEMDGGKVRDTVLERLTPVTYRVEQWGPRKGELRAVTGIPADRDCWTRDKSSTPKYVPNPNAPSFVPGALVKKGTFDDEWPALGSK